VHPADIQDRDGGVLVLSTLFGLYPFCKSSLLMRISGPVFKRLQPNPAASANRNRQTLRSGKRVRASAATLGVERTFAWLNRCRVGQGFRKSRPNALAFSTSPRFVHAQKALSELMNFSDQLLGNAAIPQPVKAKFSRLYIRLSLAIPRDERIIASELSAAVEKEHSRCAEYDYRWPAAAMNE